MPYKNREDSSVCSSYNLISVFNFSVAKTIARLHCASLTYKKFTDVSTRKTNSFIPTEKYVHLRYRVTDKRARANILVCPCNICILSDLEKGVLVSIKEAENGLQSREAMPCINNLDINCMFTNI